MLAGCSALPSAIGPRLPLVHASDNTPEDDDSVDEQIAHAAEVLHGRHIAVLTGAGISTDSGIPAYRGEGAPVRSSPMTAQTFLSDEAARRRYWLGGHLGWSRFATVAPNDGHVALAALEHSGRVTGVITQNVDGLHLRAGTRRVVELHGTVRNAFCIDCGQVFARSSVEDRIERLNPWLSRPESVTMNPDGDVSPERSDGFVVPKCTVCAGTLKPDVVFFGELVPADRWRLSHSLLHASDALLVAGTSLTVNSGIRVIERARRRGLPLAIVNREATRADAWADVVIHAGTTPVLSELAARLA